MNVIRAGRDLVARIGGEGRRTASVEGPWGRVRLETRDTDRLGVLLEAVHLERSAAPLGAAGLRTRLEAMAGRIDYLSERLVLVEHDPARTGALMRSAEAPTAGQDRHYFELRVEKDGSARFGRFRQPPVPAARTPVPALLERRTLARLVDDLLAAVVA